MSASFFIQCALFIGSLTFLSIPIGAYMARVYSGTNERSQRVGGAIERTLYRICGVDPKQEMNWQTYARAMVTFNLLGIAVVYAIQRLQHLLPFNPTAAAQVDPGLSFNTAMSFTSNTNWQAYGGESTMSYFTQLIGLTPQNFLSAATGMAVLVALIRGLRVKEKFVIGNFWVDLTRSVLYILLPFSFGLALALISQGVVQTLKGPAMVTTLEPQRISDTEASTVQRISRGPAASQIAIKQLGTNGGGFFNVNSAHPYENPTPGSNFIEMLAILLIPAACCHLLGFMVGDQRQGWALYFSMLTILTLCTFVSAYAEQAGNPRIAALAVDQRSSSLQDGGNMEGKELRFGIANSVLWANATTAASNGSVNAMHDSFMPLGSLPPLVLMQLGEVIFGGVGSGLYGMLAFVILTVFIAGLMVGRTPEYLGKKIESYEMKLVSFIILVPCGLTLLGTAFGVDQSVASSITNPGPHGLSQVLYAYSSMGNNNGSAFAGFGAAVPLHEFLGGAIMFISRYWIAIPVLALAGSLAAKQQCPAGLGTLETHSVLFSCLTLAMILIVGALTFIPAIALGPIAEYLALIS